MAATLTAVGTIPLSGQVPGQRRHVSALVTFDASYPTGGYAVTAASVGLVNIDTAVLGNSAGGLPCAWVAGKVKVFSAVGTEETATTDLHTDSVLVRFIGE